MLVDFLSNNFQDCIWLAILLVALCPTLESKIAVPLAMNSAIWGEGAYTPILAFLISSLGALLPSIIIMFLARKIKKKTTGFVSSKFLNKYVNKSVIIEKRKSNFSKYMALAALVSVPLPLTGVWSGSLIAGLSSLDLKYAFIAIAIGNLISTAAITLLCTLFSNSIMYILIISLVIIILYLTIDMFIGLLKRKKESN